MKLVIILIGFATLSCKMNNPNTEHLISGSDSITMSNQNSDLSENDDLSEDAKEWLEMVIPSVFNDGGFAMKDICTEEYYQYKTDATGVGYDGGMKETAFHGKWRNSFDTKYAGMGVGFLISGQDYGKIELPTINYIKRDTKDNYIFDLVIRDVDGKVNYPITIKIVPRGKAYLIADVLQPIIE